MRRDIPDLFIDVRTTGKGMRNAIKSKSQIQ